jgi:hypothetical protein
VDHPNARAVAWLCGAVLDLAANAQLSAGGETAFFPACRG